MQTLFSLQTKCLLVTLICCCTSAFSQNVGIGTNTPHASAQLDISSTTKGMLVPRMSMAERNAIASPAKGLVVFVNDDSSFHYFAGNSWQKLTIGADNWLLKGNASGTG